MLWKLVQNINVHAYCINKSCFLIQFSDSILDVSLELVKFNLPKSSKRKKLSQVEFANISQLQKI